MEKRQPLGIELVRKGVINESDIEKALEYQKTHQDKKLGDILNILGLCDSHTLINAIGEILGERGILLRKEDIKINLDDYISLDILKQARAVPFEIEGSRIKVCFSDTSNKRAIDTIRLLLLNKGLIIDKYITFDGDIQSILKSLEGKETDDKC